MRDASRDNPLVNIAKDCMVNRDEQRDVRLSEPTFVQQLEIIEKDEDAILEAIKDKFQAEKCRQEWYDEGHIRQTDLDDYEEKLLTVHKACSERSGHDRLSDADTRIEFGKETLNQCIIHSISIPLNAWIPQGPYNKGNLHELADRLKIGWHPNWSSILTPKKTGNA